MRSWEIRYFALRAAAVAASALVIGAGVSFVLTKGNNDAGGGGSEAPDSAQVLEASATPEPKETPAARAHKAARERGKPVKRVPRARRTAAVPAVATPQGASPERSPAARAERRGASATPSPAPRRTVTTPGGHRAPVATPRRPGPAPTPAPGAPRAPTAQPCTSSTNVAPSTCDNSSRSVGVRSVHVRPSVLR